MLGTLVDLGPKREPIPIVGNLTSRSYHGNCLLWKNGPKWLNLKSFNLPEGRLLRGREGGSLLVHALSHPYFLTSLFILFVFLCFPFPFPLPYSLYFSLFFVVFSLAIFLTCSSLLLAFLPLCCAQPSPFLYCLLWYVLLFYPSTTFGLVWVSFSGHPLVCWLLSQHHYPVLAGDGCTMFHSQTKESYFCFLALYGIPIWINVGYSLLLILMACT